MIKKLPFFACIFTLLFCGCSEKPEKIKSGRIIYAIEYPKNKDNFMLYSILPKEMTVDFNDGLIKSTIAKANLSNQLFVDCRKKDVSAYFEFGADNFYVNLKPADVQKMISDQPSYSIRFTSEEDTLAGFAVKKAIATAKNDPSDVVEIWYTEDIAVGNSNWYNPYKTVPGFLMKYAIDRYGLRMEFTAKGYEDIKPAKNELVMKPKGNEKTYNDYNNELSGLFKTFE